MGRVHSLKILSGRLICACVRGFATVFVEEPTRPLGPAEFSRGKGTNEGRFGFIGD